MSPLIQHAQTCLFCFVTQSTQMKTGFCLLEICDKTTENISRPISHLTEFLDLHHHDSAIFFPSNMIQISTSRTATAAAAVWGRVPGSKGCNGSRTQLINQHKACQRQRQGKQQCPPTCLQPQTPLLRTSYIIAVM